MVKDLPSDSVDWCAIVPHMTLSLDPGWSNAIGAH